MTNDGALCREASEVDDQLSALLCSRDQILRRIERRAAIVVRSWMVAHDRSWLSVDVTGNLAAASGRFETQGCLAAAVPMLPRRVFSGGLNNSGDFTVRLSDLDAYLDGAGLGVDGEVRHWKTVVISFVEESHHEVRVKVPRDFQPERCDLANELARLDDEGCEFLERVVLQVTDVDEDPDAEYFAPPTVW